MEPASRGRLENVILIRTVIVAVVVIIVVVVVVVVVDAKIHIHNNNNSSSSTNCNTIMMNIIDNINNNWKTLFHKWLGGTQESRSASRHSHA